ncbi:TPA: hypothetical protein ACTOC9_000976 [Campylobacter jejuni]|uniref:XRE family transcriptional regulator n=2 Tax=Campylobacter jejuni TaxID=197 RepID=A0A5T0UJ21_CAMJU|nr:hypothetical protein [Campylobacter jejuni]EIQ6974223.1 hypothetical protein [Campylobacter coli]EAB5237146.1 hypothetical protein [Campylobacter jejuni]EAB5263447.1 hypothetical protein [Campylobacter jejuni]EAB5284856.1 hypothetical protein [Campylobacter jejuni]EAB5305171.1 hypothetical protein [Campylobacter jejuni]
MTRLEFDEKIKQLGLTRKTFADIAKVSYSGISTNWKDDKEIPSWVEPFLYYYEKGLALDELLKILEKYKKESNLE